MAPPSIQTYHCLCTSLLLASTHTLSLLPRRSAPSPSSLSDNSIILPLPSTSTPPLLSPPAPSLPAEGHTTLHSLIPDRDKTTIVRREDGFEKRILHRCGRCKIVVAYELETPPARPTAQTRRRGSSTTAMDVDSGKGRGEEGGVEYEGKVLYILPGGVVSTEVMSSGRKIGEGDVDIAFSGAGGGKAVAVFE